MRTTSTLILLLLSVLLLVVTGCSNDKDNTQTVPTGLRDIVQGSADWVIYLTPGYAKNPISHVAVFVAYNKDTNYPDPSVPVELVFNGDTYQMMLLPLGEGIYGLENYIELPDEDTTISLSLNVNQNTVVTTTLPVLTSTTSIHFPETYQVNQPASISWQIEQNNQYQLAFLDTYSEDENGEPIFTLFSEKLRRTDRSHIFPANLNTNIGENMELDMGLAQMNYQCKDNVMIMFYDEDYETYGASDSHPEQKNIRLFNHMRKVSESLLR
jgi:hypothetical protein